MNYTELTQNINDKCEYTFTSNQMALFVHQAEQNIYNTTQIPALRKVVETPLTLNTPLMAVPADFLWAYSLSVVDGSGNTTFLLNKDVNFLREAYPNVSAYALPKHYAYYDAENIIVGPTPDSTYTVTMTYGHYPESIVTAGTTWLGDNFDTLLFNAAMVEAGTFLKFEPDVIAELGKMYAQSVGLFKNLGDGKLREDAYRSGQFKQPVT